MQKDQLSLPAQDNLSYQSYAKSKTIEGVKIEELKCFVEDGGYLLELGRFQQGLSEQFPDFHLKQINYAQVMPGAIKAFHLHLKQEDIWFVAPHEKLLIVLTDQRKDSPTEGVPMRFVLGGGKSQLLYIPRGVAHGAANVGQAPASIVYMINEQFTPDDPDEARLPWDFLGKEIWEITKG